MTPPIIEIIGELIDRMPRPLRYRGNRAPIVAAASCACIRGSTLDRVMRLAEIIGRHTLTQKRLDLFMRLETPHAGQPV